MKSLTINVHLKCNARCVFCVVGIPENCSNKSSTFSFEEIVEELIKGRKHGCEALCLSGGEPTIYKDIVKVVSKARELGYRNIEIKSNGIALEDKQLVDKLVHAGVTVFCISIQGHIPEIHDKVIGVEGAFHKILKAIKNIHEYDVRLYTPTCIQRENYRYLSDIAKLYKEIGSDLVCPTFIEPNGSANEHFESVVPSYSDVIPYLYEAIRIVDDAGINWALHGFPLCMIKEYEYKSRDFTLGTDVLAGTDIMDYRNYERVKYKEKGKSCDECVLTSVCGGPWKNYVKKYGLSEFEAIKNVSIGDILPPDVLLDSLFGDE